MTDYLMIFALLVFLGVLSLPTILQLAEILGDNGAPPLADAEVPRIPPSSRLTPVRVQTGTVDQAGVETQLAH